MDPKHTGTSTSLTLIKAPSDLFHIYETSWSSWAIIRLTAINFVKQIYVYFIKHYQARRHVHGHSFLVLEYNRE